MATNGKAKGARAEREACRLLLEWWQPLEPVIDGQPLTFKRTPGSGGWAHGKGRAAFGTSADVVTNAKLFPWSIEIKHREGWSRDNFLKGNSSPVWTWWYQACAQAVEANKKPMLWFRKNNMQWHVLSTDAALLVAPVQSIFVKHETNGMLPLLFMARDILSLDPRLFTTSRLVTKEKP